MGLPAQDKRKTPFARRRMVAWIAVFALIVQVFAPLGQAQAFGTDQDAEYQIICTANGLKQVLIGADGTPVEPKTGTSCPFCVMHIAPALLGPQNVSPTQVAALLEHAVFGSPPHCGQSSIWRGPPKPPRAPPPLV